MDEPINHVKGVIESLLFVNENTISLDQFKKVLPSVSAAEIKAAIASLQAEYLGREAGITILEIAGGYQMLSNRSYAGYVRDFYKTRHKAKLSKPALETVAIIAYKQPVTRQDVELIRGVNSDGVVAHLIDRELIKIVGRKDIPGKPFLYGTTKQFLEYFGLKSLEGLPKLEEFQNLKPAYEKDDIIRTVEGSEEISSEEDISDSEENTEQIEDVETVTAKAGEGEN